jgi:hypothetical protein
MKRPVENLRSKFHNISESPVGKTIRITGKMRMLTAKKFFSG